MSFAEIQETHRQLRLRLHTIVGPLAFPELNVKLPTADNDELSFVQLVVWSYALVQEAGRVSLRFLSNLPPFPPGGNVLPEAGYLRTWATHNLSLDKDSDQKKLKFAWSWLKRACGSSAPAQPPEWQACFKSLCNGLTTALGAALVASEALTSAEDGPRLVDELKRRLDRDWEAYRFDQHVADAAARLGFVGIDPMKFRTGRLDAWRQVVAAAEDGSIDRLLILRIESDLLEFMNRALPVTSLEVLERIALEDPRQLAVLLLAVRAKPERVTPREIVSLLDGLAGQVGLP